MSKLQPSTDVGGIVQSLSAVTPLTNCIPTISLLSPSVMRIIQWSDIPRLIVDPVLALYEAALIVTSCYVMEPYVSGQAAKQRNSFSY